MTIKDLEYYAAIARLGSITRAAAELYVAQPALSQCLQKLEKETGLQLFLRRSRGVELTEEGACFLTFAQNVLREQETLLSKVRDVTRGERGLVRLGFTGTQATYVLPHILPAFQEAHPTIDVELVEATSNDLEQKLLAHEVDVGILHPPLLREGLESFTLSQDEMVAIPRDMETVQAYLYERSGRTYLSPAYFQAEPLILTPDDQRSRLICDRILAACGITPRLRQVCRSLTTLDALAQVGYAATFLPEKQLSPALRQRGYYHLEAAAALPYSFVVATAHDHYTSTAMQTLLAHCKALQYTF